MKFGNSPSTSSALAALALTATAACTSHVRPVGHGPTKQSPGQHVPPTYSQTPVCETPVALQTVATNNMAFQIVEGNAHNIVMNGYAGMKKYTSSPAGTAKNGNPLQGHMSYIQPMVAPGKVGGDIILSAQLIGYGPTHLGTVVTSTKDRNEFTDLNFPGQPGMQHTMQHMVSVVQEAAACATQVGISQVNQRLAITNCLKATHPNMLITHMGGEPNTDDGEDCSTGCINMQIIDANECSK